MASEKILRIGAEAKVVAGKWHGIDVVKKVRLQKGYRAKPLDVALNRSRTKREAMLLHRAKLLGVATPIVLDVDLRSGTIILEHIQGRKAKDCIEKNAALCKEIARSIAKLHNNGIIHGDLTLDNIIVRERKPVFIDFGLGFYSDKLEDKATDLLNLKKSLLAIRPDLQKEWHIIEAKYARHAIKGRETIEKMRAIIERARYM